MTQEQLTKRRAFRIQSDYLKRHLPLRYWKRATVVVVFILTGSWILWGSTVQSNKIYMPGPISGPHKLFENECSVCHSDSWDQVPNDSCLTCHADKPHNKQEMNTLLCSSCHAEHQNLTSVANLSSGHCRDCHKNLKRKDGEKPEVVAHITNFEDDHPDWNFFENLKKDPGNIKLNHHVHLKPEITGPDGKPVTMQCSDCHEVDTKKDPQAIHRNALIKFEDHCQSCHLLGFDQQFSSAEVPHKKSEEVRTFLEDFYSNQLRENPNIVSQPLERDFAGPKSRSQNFSGPEWLQNKLKNSEKLLFSKTCFECHDYQYQEGKLPEIEDTKLFESHFKKGDFNHSTHRAVACVSCHVDAKDSKKTEDFVVPHVTQCQTCHGKGKPVDSSCQKCHQYHSEGLEKILKGEKNVGF